MRSVIEEEWVGNQRNGEGQRVVYSDSRTHDHSRETSHGWTERSVSVS